MARFKHYDYNQMSMVVINYLEQIQPGTFEFALHYLISEKLDLSAFHQPYKNDAEGRPAYDPAILLKIILFAYSKGITSSREIQWCCDTNIIFKALSCDTVPHFTTIAHFVSSRSQAIEALFEQVLLICDQQGLLGHELFAIDGCKMRSNASKEWSGTFKELEQKRQKLKRLIRHHLSEHQEKDSWESEEELDREIRKAKTILTLNEAAEKVDRFLKTNTPRTGQSKRGKEVKSNITDNQSAKMTTSKGTIQGYNGVAAVDKKHQIIIDAQAFGEGQEHHTLQPVLESIQSRYKRLGINDNLYKEGIIVTADTGFANEANMKYLHQNGINGYIPDNQFRSRDPKFAHQKEKYGKRHQTPGKPEAKPLIPASEFQFDPINLICICPAGNQVSHRGTRANDQGVPTAYFEGRLLQCRNCKKKHQCMKNPASADHRNGAGRQVSFPLNDKRPPSYTDWMKHRVDSPKGKQIYSHRMSVVEPVFGNIGTNKGLNRFSLRSKTKVQGQWQLYCLIHNIEKLAHYGKLVQ
ncbi:IS1182 family transposase [Marinospirillum alkaliphilum]|uniref:Transposase, IS4 family n=1 Tax=Marinospirillum alkaliphilum DSM 21637 TaxID=1122209 RepID=A0A1K2A6F1_9GAMM|nr:IS1182 family transposase [Marinospirillum alkaliphilum]SFX81412.1 transposase, IS4 family [Marinospirillum alkaliphilum DSM 21637]